MVDGGRPPLPREVRVLAVVAFVVALGFGIVAPAIPVYVRSFGVGTTAVGLAVSSFAVFQMASDLGGILGPLAAGALTDAVDHQLAFGVTAGVLAAGLVAALTLPRR